jgi:tRNA/rRNA methyltransferase
MSSPVIILVVPQLGENIGMVARAMLNCGCTELRLVNPRDGWPNPAAVSAASGADQIIENAKVFTSLPDAIADLQFVFATTANRRDQVKNVFTPRAAAQELRTLHQQNNKTGIVFGPERSGLVNDDLSHANALITIPVNPGFSSLNIAQAVLLIAYEFYLAEQSGAASQLSLGEGELATQGDLDNLFRRLEEELDKGGFFTSAEVRPMTVRNVRNIFQRMGLTAQEVRTFQGMISALIKGRS